MNEEVKKEMDNILNIFQQSQRDINHYLEKIAFLEKSVEYLNESLQSERKKTQYLTNIIVNADSNKPSVVLDKKNKKYHLFQKINKDGFKHKKKDMGNIYKTLKKRLIVNDNSLFIKEGDRNIPYEPNQHNF